ncbi:MAG: SAM-dependent methyltransferase, partial [Limisphaerales bacterium]
FIPHRPLKDPRTILMLDPACGSMHFGLYAFDLFEVIYDEAWALEEKLGADALSRPPGMKSLHDTYAGKDAFLKDVPRLIIEHNLHGIDIDPRCAQIAGLSLWLRAQKAWQRLGLKPAERPAIRRSNIVCAEPMPGEKELLREFVEREFPAVERAVCLRLLEAIFDKMQLAGEAGSLLKIEEEIRSAIEDARDAWQKLATRPPELFTTTELNQLSTAPELTGLEQAVSSLTTDPRLLTTDFWERIEERIYAALRDYAEQAENGGGFQRRLFAEDAARGFAFIDVCRKRYDVALMNPPFGSFTIAMADLAKTVFGRLANDIYACFVRRMGDILAEGGAVGIISSRSFVTGKGMEALRPHLLGEGETWLKLLWDFGVGVLDGAMVETAAYVYCRSTREPAVPIGFWNDKLTDKATLQFPSANRFSEKSYVFFRSLPSQQFIYEADDEVRNGLNSARRFEPHLGRVTKGLSTGSNERFVRCLWEIPQHELKSRWEFLSKGGEYRWLSCDLHLALNWGGDGRELAVFSDITNGNPARARQSSAYYFKPAVCFSGRSQKGFSARWLPAGCIFDTKSPVVVPKDVSDLPWIAPLLMSSEYQRLISLQSKFGSYDTSAIARLPLPQEILTVFVGSLPEIWFPHLKLERATETTWYFVQPPTDSDSLRAQALESLGRIDELLQETGRSLDLEVRAYTEDSIRSHDCFSGTQTGFLSYCLGVACGRWDIRYATGEQAAPELPDPFAPLPVCPPGQLQNAQGLPARPEDVPAAYPVRIPWDGILVDDPNHPLDIERRVREVIEIIWKDRAEAIEHEACEILGVKSLRDYFRKPTGFFADHLKRYSKSRRQAPIYWPLATASGSYTLWIYYHRLTPDTLYKCVQQFVNPKLADVEKELTHLRTVLAANEGGAKERKRLEELEDLRRELIELRTELELWAPKWKPNLNDGVLITACPLWKLFRLPKWQKDLKACWQELEKGDYDWAHLAHTLRPDQVREKCRTDRSLAIAHGLEELCEVKAPEKKAKKAKKK